MSPTRMANSNIIIKIKISLLYKTSRCSLRIILRDCERSSSAFSRRRVERSKDSRCSLNSERTLNKIKSLNAM